jgi:hypothetical protein
VSNPEEPGKSLYETVRAYVTSPIETGTIHRIAEAVVLVTVASVIDKTPVDVLSGGYAADVVGTTAGISFAAMFYRRGDPRMLPIATVLAANAAIEQAQKYHLLKDVPFLEGLDGRYDVRDFAAFAAGSLLYIGIGQVRNLIQKRNNKTRNTADVDILPKESVK